MNKTTLIFISMICTTALFSCGNNTGEDAHADHASMTHEAHHHDSDGNIELNNGEKWTVNEEMKPYISNSEELMNDYIENQKNDHVALAGSLEEQNNLLIKSCTMEGKSHDELHKWLHPHLELVAALKNTSDENEANLLISRLEQSFDVYHRYFH